MTDEKVAISPEQKEAFRKALHLNADLFVDLDADDLDEHGTGLRPMFTHELNVMFGFCFAIEPFQDAGSQA